MNYSIEFTAKALQGIEKLKKSNLNSLNIALQDFGRAELTWNTGLYILLLRIP